MCPGLSECENAVVGAPHRLCLPLDPLRHGAVLNRHMHMHCCSAHLAHELAAEYAGSGSLPCYHAFSVKTCNQAVTHCQSMAC